MKPILIISYYWPPSGGAGVQRWLKMVKYLPSQGIRPIVLTVNETDAAYPSQDESLLADLPNEVEVHRTRAKNFYAFYQKFTGAKKVPQGGVPGGKLTLKKRISLALRNHLFLPDPRVGWNKYAVEKAIELIQLHDIRTVVTTSPPHSTQLIGLALKKHFPKIKWVADLRDPWTDIYYYKDLKHSFVSHAQNVRLEQKVLLKADKVLTVNESLKQLFLRKNTALSGAAFQVISNGFDAADFAGVTAIKNERFTIVYTGTADKNYDFTSIIGAMERMPPGGFVFKVVGDFSPEIKNAFLQSSFGEQVQFLGYLPHDEALKQTFSADLLLLVIPKVSDNHLITTGKVFEYLAAKKPILAIGPAHNEAGKILSKTGSGQMFAYDHELGVFNFMQNAYKGMADFKPNEVQINKYTREAITIDLAKALDF